MDMKNTSIRATNRAARAQAAVQAFDDLPDCAFVSLPVIRLLLDCGPATVWRMARDGRLPSPVKIGGMARWSVGALRAALRGEQAKAA